MHSLVGQRHFRSPYKHEAQASVSLRSDTHSLARRACMPESIIQSGAVQLASIEIDRPIDEVFTSKTCTAAPV